MSKVCQDLHSFFNSLKRFSFPFDKNEAHLNGIYILFEKGEKGHETDRIVRIGTHTGQDQLRSRLMQHFVNENKDRSIFRKNIGRAILNKNKDSFLPAWELDLTSKAAREFHINSVDFNKQKEVEKEVSRYIQDNFSFALIPVEDKARRLEIEAKLISTISLCDDCKPSKTWLGNFSTKDKIRDSGLWLVNELYKQPISEKEFDKIKKELE